MTGFGLDGSSVPFLYISAFLFFFETSVSRVLLHTVAVALVLLLLAIFVAFFVSFYLKKPIGAAPGRDYYLICVVAKRMVRTSINLVGTLQQCMV